MNTEFNEIRTTSGVTKRQYRLVWCISNMNFDIAYRIYEKRFQREVMVKRGFVDPRAFRTMTFRGQPQGTTIEGLYFEKMLGTFIHERDRGLKPKPRPSVEVQMIRRRMGMGKNNVRR